MGIFDKIQTPVSNKSGTSTQTPKTATTGGVFSSIANPPSKPQSVGTGGIFANVQVTKPQPKQPETPYWATTDEKGVSYGPSAEKDVTGRPYLDYRTPTAGATTTDKTRVNTRFDPRVASSTLTRDDFYNPRYVENKAQLKLQMGGAYSDELDHKIALALSGSNDPKNLRPQPADENNDSAKISELQQKVLSGKLSLFDAQMELAKWKGIETPFTGIPDEPKSVWDTVTGKIADAMSYRKDVRSKIDTAALEWSQGPKLPPGVVRPQSTLSLAGETIKGIPEAAYNTAVNLPGALATVFNPKNAVEPTKELGRSALEEIGNFMSNLGTKVLNTYASGFNKVTGADLKAEPANFTHEVKPGMEPAFMAGKIIGGAVPYIAGGAVAAPALQALATAPAWVRILGIGIFNTALPAAVTAVAPLQEGETQTSRFLAELPTNVLFGLTSVIPGKLQSALATGVTQLGISAYKGEDPQQNFINAAVLTMFGLAGHEQAKAFQDINSLKARAKKIVDTDLGPNPSDVDVSIKKSAQAFLDSNPADQASFMEKAKGVIQSIVDTHNATPNKKGGFVKNPLAGEDVPSRAVDDGSSGLNEPDMPNTLVALHNLTENKIRFSEKIGGIVNPSLAIVDAKKQGLENFGEITLVAPKNMIDPKTAEKARTYGADIYSPRFPTVESIAPYKSIDTLKQKFPGVEQKTGDSLANIDTGDMHRSLESNVAIMGAFLEKTNIDIPTKYNSNGEVDRYDTRRAIRDIFAEQNLDAKFTKFIDNIATEVGTEQKIFDGYTNSGKRRYQPLTAENASKIMNKENLRGGEGFFYGLGNVRSKVAPEFKSLDKMKAAKEKIISSPEFEKIKEEYDQKLTDVITALEPYSKQRDSNRFIDSSNKTQAVSEFLGGDKGALQYQYENIPSGLMDRLTQFKNELKSMPTEYFETKFKRPVDIGEFTYALVPKEVSIDVKEMLEAKGLKVVYYDGETGRADALKNIMKLQDGKTFFKKGTEDVYDTPNPEIKKLAESLFDEREIGFALRRNLIEGDALGKFSSKPDPFTGQFKNLIEIVTKDGNASSFTLYHEAFHGYFNTFIPASERAFYLNQVKSKLVTLPERAQLGIDGYKGADQRAEEWLANDFARYAKAQRSKGTATESKNEYNGPFARLWQKMYTHIKDIFARGKEVESLYQDILNKKRSGYVEARFTDPKFQKIDDEIVRQEDKLKEAYNKSGESDVVGFSKADAALTEVMTELELAEPGYRLMKDYGKDFEVSAVPSTFPEWIPDGLRSTEMINKILPHIEEGIAAIKYPEGNRPAQRRFVDTLFDVIDVRIGVNTKDIRNNILKLYEQKRTDGAVKKGVSSSTGGSETRGATASGAGEPTAGFARAKEIVDVATSEGRKLSQAEFDRATANNYVEGKREAEVYAKASAEEKKKIETERRARLKMLSDAADAKMKLEMQKESARKQKLYQTVVSDAKSEGFIAKFKRWLYPIKAEDEATQKIYKEWVGDVLLSRELAQEELRKFDTPKKDEMHLINEYQAGVKNEYNDKVRDIFDRGYEEASRRGSDIGYKERYLPGVYANSHDEILAAVKQFLIDGGMDPVMIDGYLSAGKRAPNDVVRALKITPTFERAKVFPDYKTAMQYGLTPKYKNIPSLVAYWRDQLERSLAGQKFVENLYEAGKIVPSQDAPADWMPLNRQFSPFDYKASPRLAKTLNAIFKDDSVMDVWPYLFNLGSRTSKLTQQIMLSSGIPKTTVNFFAIGNAISSLTRALGSVATLNPKLAASELKTAWSFMRANFDKSSVDYFEQNTEYLKLMADEGINLGQRVGGYQAEYEQTIRNTKIQKAFGIAEDVMLNAFDEKTFGSFMPQMYTQVFKDTYTSAIEKGLTEQQAQKLAGDTTKATFGMVDDVGRSSNTKDVISSFFFAPHFRESLINVYSNTMRSMSTEFRNPAFARNRTLFVGMAITLAIYDYLNYKNNKTHVWENEPGHELDLKIPTPDGTVIYVPFMPSTFAFMRSILTGTSALVKGDVATAQQKFGSLFSTPIKITFELISNQDYFGNPIYKETDDGTTKAWKIARYIGLQVNHPYVKEIVNQINDKKPLYQSIVTALELPVSFSSKEKINLAKDFRDRESQRKEQVRAEEAFLPTYEHIRGLFKADPNDSSAQALLDALPPEEYDMYKSLKSAEKSKATRALTSTMRDTVEKVEELKKAGDTEGVVTILNSLSEEEYKAFQKEQKLMGITPSIQTQ